MLSRYDIWAPDVLHDTAGETFEVKAEFYDADGRQLRGGRLFVQCFLITPSGRYYRTTLADDGRAPDTAANDGTYTGGFPRLAQEMEAGTWSYFVIAQDVNDADPGMDPDQAAQIIGGMVVTHQLTIDFSGGTCPLVPDGQVEVVA